MHSTALEPFFLPFGCKFTFFLLNAPNFCVKKWFLNTSKGEKTSNPLPCKLGKNEFLNFVCRTALEQKGQDDFAPLLALIHSFDCTELPSPRRISNEPSLELRRALAWMITSPRSFSRIKCAFRSIPSCATSEALLCSSIQASYVTSEGFHSPLLRVMVHRMNEITILNFPIILG